MYRNRSRFSGHKRRGFSKKSSFHRRSRGRTRSHRSYFVSRGGIRL